MSIFTAEYAPQILVGLLFALFIVALRRWVPQYPTLPIAFLVFLIILNVALFGTSSRTTRRASSGSSRPWAN